MEERETETALSDASFGDKMPSLTAYEEALFVRKLLAEEFPPTQQGQKSQLYCPGSSPRCPNCGLPIRPGGQGCGYSYPSYPKWHDPYPYGTGQSHPGAIPLGLNYAVGVQSA